MLISVCILVKDASTTFEQAMVTALSLGDEVILRVDDSSSDPSMEMAERFERELKNVRVVPYTFVDFGSARNGLIHEAQGEWIFMLDADETIDILDCIAIRNWLLTSPPKHIYSFPRKNWQNFERTNFRTDHYPDNQHRLFPNDGVVNYGEQKVHEMPKGQPASPCPLRNIHINHFCFAIRGHEEWHAVNQFYKKLGSQLKDIDPDG